MKKQGDYHLHDGISGTAVAVRVKTAADANRVAKVLDDGTVEIRLKVKGAKAANAALVKYLAKIIDVNPSCIEVVAGEDGNKKLVTFTDVDKATVHKAIVGQLS